MSTEAQFETWLFETVEIKDFTLTPKTYKSDQVKLTGTVRLQSILTPELADKLKVADAVSQPGWTSMTPDLKKIEGVRLELCPLNEKSQDKPFLTLSLADLKSFNISHGDAQDAIHFSAGIETGCMEVAKFMAKNPAYRGLLRATVQQGSLNFASIEDEGGEEPPPIAAEGEVGAADNTQATTDAAAASSEPAKKKRGGKGSSKKGVGKNRTPAAKKVSSRKAPAAKRASKKKAAKKSS